MAGIRANGAEKIGPIDSERTADFQDLWLQSRQSAFGQSQTHAVQSAGEAKAAIYSGTKGAVDAITRGLAAELGPFASQRSLRIALKLRGRRTRPFKLPLANDD